MDGLARVQATMFAPQARLIVLLLALVRFGGKQLPAVGRARGQPIREFKRATEAWQRPSEPERPPAPPPALSTQTGYPAGRAAGIERAEEAIGGGPRPLSPAPASHDGPALFRRPRQGDTAGLGGIRARRDPGAEGDREAALGFRLGTAVSSAGTRTCSKAALDPLPPLLYAQVVK